MDSSVIDQERLKPNTRAAHWCKLEKLRVKGGLKVYSIFLSEQPTPPMAQVYSIENQTGSDPGLSTPPYLEKSNATKLEPPILF